MPEREWGRWAVIGCAVLLAGADLAALVRVCSGNEAPAPLSVALADHTLLQDSDFTIVALPDTQYYSSGHAAIFNAQTQWIVDHRTSNNIVFVTHLGDIVDDANSATQWNRANNALTILEGSSGVPYGLDVGNHDQQPQGTPAGTEAFNSHFPYTRYAGKPWYGGHLGSDNDNSYQFFSAGSLDFIIIHLEYDTSANPDVLAWADGLLKSYSQRRAIVSSHCILDRSLPDTFSTQGQAIYDALKGNPNLFLMVCGHSDYAQEGRRTDVYNGNTIYTLLSDYQKRANGGDGWLRLLVFSPANNQISVKTYSPTRDEYETDANSQFTLSYAMSSDPVPPSITQHPSPQSVATGQTATFTVAATGTPPLSYQWQKDGANFTNGGHYSGATTVTLTVSNADINDVANYHCVVTNNYGSAISNDAALVLTGQPTITQQPLPQNACTGGTAAFTVAASAQGTITYQWQKNGANVTDGGHYSGTTTPTVTISNAGSSDAAFYRCVVTNPAGSTYSNQAPLAIDAVYALVGMGGTNSSISGVSTDGVVVAGNSSNGGFIWSMANGLVGLGAGTSTAGAAIKNGAVVVGGLSGGSASRWNGNIAGAGTWTTLPLADGTAAWTPLCTSAQNGSPGDVWVGGNLGSTTGGRQAVCYKESTICPRIIKRTSRS